jgi:hypothetical protein
VTGPGKLDVHKNMMKFSHFCLPLALTSAACAPTIYQFEATPSKVCKGQTAKLHWNATHGGSITATPPNESPGTVFGQGSSVVTPQASGTYQLQSKNVILTEEREVRVEVTEPCSEPGPAVAAAPAPAP